MENRRVPYSRYHVSAGVPHRPVIHDVVVTVALVRVPDHRTDMDRLARLHPADILHRGGRVDRRPAIVIHSVAIPRHPSRYPRWIRIRLAIQDHPAQRVMRGHIPGQHRSLRQRSHQRWQLLANLNLFQLQQRRRCRRIHRSYGRRVHEVSQQLTWRTAVPQHSHQCQFILATEHLQRPRSIPQRTHRHLQRVVGVHRPPKAHGGPALVQPLLTQRIQDRGRTPPVDHRSRDQRPPEPERLGTSSGMDDVRPIHVVRIRHPRRQLALNHLSHHANSC